MLNKFSRALVMIELAVTWIAPWWALWRTTLITDELTGIRHALDRLCDAIEMRADDWEADEE